MIYIIFYERSIQTKFTASNANCLPCFSQRGLLLENGSFLANLFYDSYHIFGDLSDIALTA